MNRRLLPPLDADEAAALRDRVLAFFDDRARSLPWRETRDPYAVWVSEVMLQQTRVETAIGYYRRWMERFPTLDALATAEREEVLEAWAGLGYYSRARNLHDASRLVRERHGGRVPETPGALRELPGIGEYTAGAVASIAFGAAVPAVDGNVRRVLSRLFDVADPRPALLRDLASLLVDPDRPGAFNQGLMELGATVCTPRSPRCGECPLEAGCRARAGGTVEERPVRRARALPRVVELGVAVCWRMSPPAELLLERRPAGGLLGGMWAFPGGEREPGEAPEDAALRAAERVAVTTGPIRPLPELRHRFTHLDARYRPFLAEVAGDAEGEASLRWIRRDELAGAALPAAERRIAERAFRALAEAPEARAGRGD